MAFRPSLGRRHRRLRGSATSGAIGTPAPVPALFTVNRLARPSNTVATAPVFDPSPTAPTALSAVSTRAVLVDPTDQRQAYQGVGCQIQHATQFNLTTFAPAKAAEVFANFFGASDAGGDGPNVARVYTCSGAFLSFPPRPDGSTDYMTLLGPVSRNTPEDETLPSFNTDRWEQEVGAPLRKAFAANPKLRVFLSDATPPAWMKLNYNDASVLDSRGLPAPGTAGHMNTAFYPHNANKIVRLIQYMKADPTLPPVAWVSAVNEPFSAADAPAPADAYPTCGWTQAQMVSFYGDYLWPRLIAAGLATAANSSLKLWLAETNANDVPSAGVSVYNALASKVGRENMEIAVHGYHYDNNNMKGGGTRLNTVSIPSTTVGNMSEWRTKFQDDDGTPHYLPEAQFDWWTQFMDAFQGRFASFSGFVLCLDENGNPTTNNLDRRGIVQVNRASGAITYNPEFYLLTMIGRHLKVGDVRVGTTTATSGVRIVSFYRAAENKLVHFLFNPSQTTSYTHDVVNRIDGTSFAVSVGPLEGLAVAQPGLAAIGATALPLTGLTVTAGNAGNVVSIVSPIDGNRKGIELYRGDGTTGTKALIAVLPPGLTIYPDPNLTNGQAYTYAAYAFGNGRSAATADVTATPSATAAPTIAFGGTSASVAEGNSLTTTVTNALNLSRNGVAGPLTVNLTFGGSATAGTDYATPPTSVTFPDGASSASFDLAVNGDTLTESDETIVVTAVLAGYTGSSATRTVTIANDDAAPAYLFRSTLTSTTGTRLLAGHVAETGQTARRKSAISTATGDVSISSDGVAFSANPSGHGTYDTALSTPYQRMEVDFTQKTTADVGCSVGFHCVPDGDGGLYITYRVSTGVWSLSRRGTGAGVINSAGGTPISVTDPIAAGATVTAVATYNTDNTVSLYVRGVLIGTTAAEPTYTATGNIDIRFTNAAGSDTTGTGPNDIRVTAIA